MTNQTNSSPEIQMPFIAEIIMGLITLFAAHLYFSDLLLPLLIFIPVAIIVLRRNAWTVSAAILMTLAYELYQRQRNDELQVVLILLGIGIVLQLIAAVWQRYRLGYWGSSFAENAIFATIGLIIGYGIQFRLCQPGLVDLSTSGVLYLWEALVGCTVAIAMEPVAQVPPATFISPDDIILNPGMETVSPELFIGLGLVCVRMFFLMPVTWVALLAGFRASGLALWNPGRVLGFTFRAFIGTQILGIFTFFCLLIIGGIDLMLNLSGITAFSQFLNMTLLAIILTTLIVGAAWGAGWGN